MQRLTDNSGWNSENHNAESNADGKGQGQQIEIGKKKSIESWAREHELHSGLKFVLVLSIS